jgi:glycosyltransferase involved in cell wall biosynthesis
VSWYRHWLLRFQRRYECDVWHCHSVYPCGYLAALCPPQKSVPWVITSHGGDIRPGNVRLKKHRLPPRFQLALRRAGALIAISRFTEQSYRRLEPDVRNIVRIPNGVDLEPFANPVLRPQTLPAEIPSGQYALFIGRLHERKGVDVLLKALTRVPRAAGVDLVVAGDGPARFALERQVFQLNLGNRVRFVGAVQGETKTWLLQNARFVVVPSRTWESFGLVVLEAYAAGRPVVASSLPGLADLIESEQTGLLVPPDSPDALAQAVGRLLNDAALADAWGRQAAIQVGAFSWQAIAQRHLELYAAVGAA